ncbi:MAG: phosphate acyltransferase PlsX [Syntrophomonadaceae bacterium]|jgi:glycerol-3-phosphate acyltransferase PlsX
MRIAVDLMGGDYAPDEILAGALTWAKQNDSQIILVGNQSLIEDKLKEDQRLPNIKVVNAEEVIGMDESPVTAIRKKKNSSIVIATSMVKEKQADAVVSCGSTGAQMAAALFILGRMENIERPPIAAAIPNLVGTKTLLLDVGANVDCKPKQLLQFAYLGKAYATMFLGEPNPRVALLNNGEEETKGSTLYAEAFSLLKQQPNLNFIGNIEGRDLFSHKSDVIICDGFLGNVLLKTMEGMAVFMGKLIREELGYLPGMFAKIDYTQVGGAPLLGVNGVSVVCHGSSKRDAVFNGIKTAHSCVVNNFVKLQKLELAKLLNV